MSGRHSRLALVGVLALCVSVGLGAGVADAKKKKSKVGGAIDITTTGAVIPDETAGVPGIDGILNSTANVGGKKFKGTRIRDANVTFQITGTGMNSIADLKAQLTAPNGATSLLFFSGQLGPGNLLGPVTFDDESKLGLGAGAPPILNSNFIFAPWQGTVQPTGSPLGIMDDGPASGTWTLTIRDDDNGNTNTLLSWRLVAVAGRPFKTK